MRQNAGALFYSNVTHDITYDYILFNSPQTCVCTLAHALQLNSDLSCSSNPLIPMSVHLLFKSPHTCVYTLAHALQIPCVDCTPTCTPVCIASSCSPLRPTASSSLVPSSTTPPCLGVAMPWYEANPVHACPLSRVCAASSCSSRQTLCTASSCSSRQSQVTPGSCLSLQPCVYS